MHVRFAGLLAIAALSHLAFAAEPPVVWQIGAQDNTYRDLSPAGTPAGYAKAFPKDVLFTVGQSDAKKDFSAIHPGPMDAWAGSREHPFAIAFDVPGLQPGAYELRIDIVDTYGGAPTVYHVKVNDRAATAVLDPGAGDLTLVRPENGKHRTLRYVFGADLLKPAGNRIELRTSAGAWLLYDAITLSRMATDANPAADVQATASIFFIEKEGALLQEVGVRANAIIGTDEVKAEVLAGDKPIGSATLGKALLGAVSGPVHIEPTDAPRELTVRVTCGNQRGTATIKQTPQRKWQIYVAPATHTDIGYTDIQSRVIEVHNRNTELALELCRDFPLYHWNLESSWAAQMWLRDRQPWRHEELYNAARQKRVGIEASYLNMLTGLCSDEELIRTMYYSARLNREHGVPFESYTLTDAPSHVWSMPSMLAGAGIKSLSVGINGTRAPILKQNIHHKSPFWWEGPDGQKILTWFAVGYSQAGQIGLRDGMDRMRGAIERDLYWWEHRKDYPYDAILLHGAYSDNVAIGRDIADSLADYSKHYAYPKVILCANNDFFQYVEKNFADKIPTVRGCGGSWWEDGAGSSAMETGINRVAHQDAIVAEAAWACAAGTNGNAAFPQADFNRVWDNMLLYDEHTWGAHNSIGDPTSDFVLRQFAVKAAYATDAARDVARLLDTGLTELAAHVERGSDGAERLLVFNPSGRPRTGVVYAKLPRGAVVIGQDAPAAQQRVNEDALHRVDVAFVATDVPAGGYATYRIGKEAAESAATPRRFDGKVLENDFYRVTFDRASGGVSSIVDKKLGKELVDAASKYKLGQLVYAAHGGNKGKEGHEETQVECPNVAEVQFTTAKSGKIEAGMNGPVCSSAKIVSNLPLIPRIEMEVVLYEADRRIDFVFRLNKKMTTDKEAVYIAFPYAGKNPKFRYEIGGANVRPNEDQFPGSCRDWFSVQRWVTVNTDDAAVAWSPIDTPLITLCDMTPGKWLDTLPVSNGTIFAYVMNNYWFTNYKAGQDGQFTFRYSMTSDASIDPGAASLFGEAAATPMRAVTVPPVKAEPTLPAAKSFCRVQPENVMITAMKRADDGKGVIVRVRETAGKATDATITVEMDGVKKATKCDLVERTQGDLALDGGKVSLKVGANAMATVRLE
jgi:alpha-mannosidase